jgi:cytoskeletal protein CcmA (bactofilin family)
VSLFDRGRRRDGKDAPEAFEPPAQPEPPAVHAVPPGEPEGSRPVASPSITFKPSQATPVAGGGNMANIGKSISLKGDLSGNEDLVVEGHVEGRVDLPNNQLTIGANGSVAAEVHAKTVIVVGKVTGNVSASERIEIQATGLVNGDVSAPRLIVQEGAIVNGSIEMGTKKQPAGATAAAGPGPSLTPVAEKKALP